ncbi:MAG: 3-hydroxyacyl-CoA dehydrogenase [Thermoleophilia bacterium]
MPDATFFLQRVETRAGPLALVTLTDGEDWRRPTVLGRAALESGRRVVAQLEEGEWVAAVVTGKPFVFCAGADIDEFPTVRTRTQAIEGSRAGHQLFGRIRALPFPTVAAINGACLGGGLELALHCSARTISASVRHLGLPECFLGLVPAWGGTQLLPRLVGPERAVEVIVANPLRQNRLLDADQARALGLVDRVYPVVDLVDSSIAFALELAEKGLPSRPEPDWTSLEETMRRARAHVDDVVHGAAPAPYRALDLIEGASRWTIEEGYRQEEEAIADLLPGPHAQASVYAYMLVERRARRGLGRPQAAPRPLRKVGVVGAGLMGTQLATLFLRRLRVPVVLQDVDQGIVDRALGQVRAELEGAARRGRLSSERARFLGSIVSGSTSYQGFHDCDLVIEAVLEELEVKQRVLAETEAQVAKEALLATNTSSLSVTAMAKALARPERLAGMHFFNPVAVMPLVEIVRTPLADDVSLATAFQVATDLGKRPVLVRDAPAFVVNRVLARLMRVVLDAIEHATPIEEADRAILGLGLPMAPSVLLQMVGPRVAAHVLETLHRAYPDRFPLSPTLANYAQGRDEAAIVEERPWSQEEVRGRALEAIADEVRHLLEEAVVGSAKDVDTCLLLGAGFPFFLGGITKHLDQTGVSHRVVGRPLSELGAE